MRAWAKLTRSYKATSTNDMMLMVIGSALFYLAEFLPIGRKDKWRSRPRPVHAAHRKQMDEFCGWALIASDQSATGAHRAFSNKEALVITLPRSTTMTNMTPSVFRAHVNQKTYQVPEMLMPAWFHAYGSKKHWLVKYDHITIRPSNADTLGGSDTYVEAYRGSLTESQPHDHCGISFCFRIKHPHDHKLQSLLKLVECSRCGCPIIDLLTLIGKKHIMCPRCQKV